MGIASGIVEVIAVGPLSLSMLIYSSHSGLAVAVAVVAVSLGCGALANIFGSLIVVYGAHYGATNSYRP